MWKTRSKYIDAGSRVEKGMFEWLPTFQPSFGYRRYNFQELGVWILARVCRVQPVHVRQQEKIVGMNHRRGYGRKRVVVAEFNFLDISCPVRFSHKRTVQEQGWIKAKGRHTLTEMVSFSFTIGTTPIDNSSLKVLTALRYLVR